MTAPLTRAGERKTLKRVAEREPFVPSLIGLEEMAMFGGRDFPEAAGEAKQAVLRLKLRRDHGCGLRGQVVDFDRTGGQA